MIRSKAELAEYIESDNNWYKPLGWKAKIIDRICSNNGYMIKKYLRLLRKYEYHLNNARTSRRHAWMSWYFERHKNKLGRLLGIEIYANCFGKGLQIWHAGGIVVHPDARIGENCILHGGNCIGNNGRTNEVPVLGDNVDIGFGAYVIGDVKIADGVIIGANTIVTKSVDEPDRVVTGVV